MIESEKAIVSAMTMKTSKLAFSNMNKLEEQRLDFEDEITTIMLQRLEKDFGITDFGIKISESEVIDPIKDIWIWFVDIMNNKDSPNKANNTNVAYLSQIYDSLISSYKNSVDENEDFEYVYGIKVLKQSKMKDFFNLFGWPLDAYCIDSTSKDLKNKSKKWEKKGQFARSATLLCLHFDFQSGINVLRMFLESGEDKDGEVAVMIPILESFLGLKNEIDSNEALSALVRKRDFVEEKIEVIGMEGLKIKSKMDIMKEHVRKFNFKNRYLQLLRNFLCGDYNLEDILVDNKIAFFDRLAFLLRHCPSNFVQILEGISQFAIENSALEFIILYGKGETTSKIIHNFIDEERDIQTGAYVTCLLSILLKYKQDFFEQIQNSYHHFLNLHKYYNNRANFDKQRYELIETYSKSATNRVNKGATTFCYYCKTPLNHKHLVKSVKTSSRGYNQLKKEKKQIIKYCPNCLRKTSNCSICMRPLHIQNPKSGIDAMRTKKANMEAKNQIRIFENSIIWCQNCQHGGHANDYLEWFKLNNSCPVSGCACQCNNL